MQVRHEDRIILTDVDKVSDYQALLNQAVELLRHDLTHGRAADDTRIEIHFTFGKD